MTDENARLMSLLDDACARIAELEQEIAAAITEAKRQTWIEAADICESMGHYCGTNVWPAIAQIAEAIRDRAPPRTEAMMPRRGSACDE